MLYQPWVNPIVTVSTAGLGFFWFLIHYLVPRWPQTHVADARTVPSTTTVETYPHHRAWRFIRVHDLSIAYKKLASHARLGVESVTSPV